MITSKGLKKIPDRPNILIILDQEAEQQILCESSGDESSVASDDSQFSQLLGEHFVHPKMRGSHGWKDVNLGPSAYTGNNQNAIEACGCYTSRSSRVDQVVTCRPTGSCILRSDFACHRPRMRDAI